MLSEMHFLSDLCLWGTVYILTLWQIVILNVDIFIISLDLERYRYFKFQRLQYSFNHIVINPAGRHADFSKSYENVDFSCMVCSMYATKISLYWLQYTGIFCQSSISFSMLNTEFIFLINLVSRAFWLWSQFFVRLTWKLTWILLFDENFPAWLSYHCTNRTWVR